MTVRVIVIDDSALMRQVISTLLDEDPDIEVVAAARDAYEARALIKQFDPDVITLDVEMPRMDGIEFLEKVMRLRPMPVVMISTLTQKSAAVTLQALELGAVDIVAKPTRDMRQGMENLGFEMRAKVKSAACARIKPLLKRDKPKLSAPVRSRQLTDKIIAIGASTGGVPAIRTILEGLPASAPAILIAQHMPKEYTARFAGRMDNAVSMRVVEAGDGMRIMPGHVYIAPGDRHLKLMRSGANLLCKLDDGPAVTGHRPSVNVLFQSVATALGSNAIGAILTGMGRDGAEGLLAMRQAGASTIGQTERSCVVYGMPKSAQELGAVEQELDLDAIAPQILALTGGGMQEVRI